MTDTISHFGEALAYEDYLPLSLQPQRFVPDPAFFVGLNDKNEEILQNILVLEKHHSDFPEDDADRTTIELSHIDLKLNLLLDLMVQVYSKELDIPPETAVSLRPSRMHWRSEQVQQQGEYLLVNLYLSRRFPRPLSLFGQVSSVEAHEQSGFRITLALDHISEPVLDLLERFIFLKHRRMVASTRREKT